MPVINKESLVAEDLEKKTGINRLEIRNFREKLGDVQLKFFINCTKKFFIKWSEFSIGICISGDLEHLSLYLTNHSDWMV